MREIIDVMIAETAIQKRIEELAEEVTRDYDGRELSLICVLKGGVLFLADLARRIRLPRVEMDFMDVSSYGNETESSGIVRIDKDLEQPITGKHVLLVEDIIDTGRTIHRLIDHLHSQHPASLKICALLNKPERREIGGVDPDYIGFTIPDQFVVGYGLDYAQNYRHLPYIGVMRFVEE